MLALDGAQTRLEDPALWRAGRIPRRKLYLWTNSEVPVDLGAHPPGSDPIGCPYLPTKLGLAGSDKASWLFTPECIKHDPVKTSAERNSGQFKLRVLSSNPIAQLFRYDPPGERIFLTCAVLTAGDPTVFWVGEVALGEYIADGTECTLTANHLLASLQRAGLTRKHPRVDPSNPFDLTTGRIASNAYDESVSYFRWREDGLLSIDSDGRPSVPSGAPDYVRGAQIVVPQAANHPDGWFEGGFIVIDPAYSLDADGNPLFFPRLGGLTAEQAAASDLHGGVRRSIAVHVGGTLVLDSPLPELSYSTRQRASLFVGYDGSVGQAKDRFNNIKNYWGFPWIPTKNPFEAGIRQQG